MRKPDWRVWLENKENCKHWLDYYLKKAILRKSSDESRLHLRKTDHNLNLANWISKKHKNEIPEIFGEEKFYDWVITIYYYAIYHASLALVSKEGYKSKNHSATLCFLIYHHYHLQKAFDKEDVELIVSSLNKEDIKIVGSSKELREKACYDVHGRFEQMMVDYIHEQAVTFVNKIRLVLQR